MNSASESQIDVAADIAAINAGRAVRATVGGSVQYTVNGRSYGVEPTGRAYPISGPGIHQLGRLSFKALGVYNTFGHSERAELILNQLRDLTAEQRAAALQAFLADRGSR